MIKILILSLLITIFISFSTCLVPQVTKCKGSDAKCILQSSREVKPILVAGIPEAGIEQLDPIFIKFANASTSTIKLLAYNTTLEGQKTCDIVNIERDLARSKLLLELQCDMLVKGQYEMDGKLSVLPIVGKGDYFISAKKYHFKSQFDLEDYIGEDGKKHWKIPRWTFTCEILGKGQVRLENLFGGNKVLSQAIDQLLETNPNVLLNEICVPFTEATLKIDVKAYNKFFKYFPVEDLSLD